MIDDDGGRPDEAVDAWMSGANGPGPGPEHASQAENGVAGQQTTVGAAKGTITVENVEQASKVNDETIAQHAEEIAEKDFPFEDDPSEFDANNEFDQYYGSTPPPAEYQGDGAEKRVEDMDIDDPSLFVPPGKDLQPTTQALDANPRVATEPDTQLLHQNKQPFDQTEQVPEQVMQAIEPDAQILEQPMQVEVTVAEPLEPDTQAFQQGTQVVSETQAAEKARGEIDEFPPEASTVE